MMPILWAMCCYKREKKDFLLFSFFWEYFGEDLREHGSGMKIESICTLKRDLVDLI